MAPYLCPVCRANRTHFQLTYRLLQEVHLDPDTGEIVYASDELELASRAGEPEIEVRCQRCGYAAAAATFERSARRHGDTPRPSPAAGPGRPRPRPTAAARQ